MQQSHFFYKKSFSPFLASLVIIPSTPLASTSSQLRVDVVAGILVLMSINEGQFISKGSHFLAELIRFVLRLLPCDEAAETAVIFTKGGAAYAAVSAANDCSSLAWPYVNVRRSTGSAISNAGRHDRCRSWQRYWRRWLTEVVRSSAGVVPPAGIRGSSATKCRKPGPEQWSLK
jgi:hypothetical protein